PAMRRGRLRGGLPVTAGRARGGGDLSILTGATLRLRQGPLAQLVEQGTLNPKVAGSIPARPMTKALLAMGLSHRPGSAALEWATEGATGGRALRRVASVIFSPSGRSLMSTRRATPP